MGRISVFVALVAALLTGVARAQHHHPGGHGHHQPYSSFQTRAIKALPDEQIAQMRDGAGMGLALAAELNGYPGPKHVLELADRLGLTPAQHQETEALFASMRKEAIAAGEATIAAEAELDALFASGKADGPSLEAAMDKAGRAGAALRLVHLSYHLPMKSLLTEAQVASYRKLRGYAAAPAISSSSRSKH